MPQQPDVMERRTSADSVFEYLYEQICSLELMPGTKISEAEIAAQFGVSRQPVRDAFSKLGSMELLLIRPQKATEVRKFTMRAIHAARFIRLSIELEVTRKAATEWNGSLDKEVTASLNRQGQAKEANDVDRFHAEDYAFHELLSQAAQSEFAFKMVQDQKARVDRLCVLSLSSEYGMAEILADHIEIVEQLYRNDADGAVHAMRRHLSRLDGTIETIRNEHSEYFYKE